MNVKEKIKLFHDKYYTLMLTIVVIVCGVNAVNLSKNNDALETIVKKQVDMVKTANDYYIDSRQLGKNILITAAHLDKVDGYTLLYKDNEKDLAYYMKDNPTYTKLNTQDVDIEGLENCKIEESSEGEFIVSTSTPDRIVNGMSGQRVYSSHGNELGYVIGLVSNSRLKCRTSE